MVFRPFLFEPTACASYLFGCLTHSQLALVDPHVKLVDRYFDEAERLGAPIGAVFETHVQADHVSGLSALVEVSGATAYLPAGAEVDFDHVELGDGDVVELGNTLVCKSQRPATLPRTTHTSSPTGDVGPRSHGSSLPATRFSSVTWAAPTCTRAGILSRRPESSIAPCTVCSSYLITSSSIRATSVAPSAGAACPEIRSRLLASSAAKRGARPQRRGELREHCAHSTCLRRPPTSKR